MNDANDMTEQECVELFGRLFPGGPAGGDVLAELAPEGWERSELLAVAHPTPAVLLEEAVRLHKNLENLPWGKKDEPASPEPTMEEVMETYRETPVEAVVECAEIVGKCVWDIFSDNHEVLGPDGRVAEIGSFRGAGGFVADWLNGALENGAYQYMDFYMGTVWIGSRADMSGVYRMIFRRLKALGCDWKYSFPRLGVVRFGGPAEAGKIADYDPAKALEAEQAEAKRQAEFEEMEASLREGYNESVRDSRKRPIPEVVKAYMNVYGRLPVGWPPKEEEC